jgi:hypothetical protein
MGMNGVPLQEVKTQNFPKLYDLIDMNDPDAIMEEVQTIAVLVSPAIDFAPINSAYQDILRLFAGRFPGYQGCNTAYHDIFHTLDVLLASLRLVHGVATTGTAFHAREISQIFLTALMHDTGYIQRQSESSGTGAQYTAIHVERSIDFISSYFSNGLKTKVDLEAMVQILRCTGLTVRIDAIAFKSEGTRLLGFVLGTADLLGQMSDRYYAEKLPILYEEFQEAGIPGFSSDFDLIQKTSGFYAMATERFANTLGGMNCFMKNHFLARWNIDCDLYALSIERNLEFLKSIASGQDFKTKAKRTRQLKVPFYLR